MQVDPEVTAPYDDDVDDYKVIVTRDVSISTSQSGISAVLEI